MSLTGTFRFHAVGQGLFYSGILNTKQKKFSFVYDCGTKSSRKFLENEIDNFKDLLPGKKKRLDLLIVSHLHDDHVNGLEYLLKDLTVDSVVIPYTDEIISYTALAESSGEEEFLLDFYRNPIKWFSDKKVNRILVVNGENEYNDQQSAIGRMEFEGRKSSLSFDNDISPQDYYGIELFELHNNVEITINNMLWKFQFRNMKLKIAEDYKKIVNNFKNEKKVSLEDIFRNQNSKDDFIKAVNGITTTGKIINQTSVVMLHEPIQYNKSQTIIPVFGYPWKRRANNYDPWMRKAYNYDPWMRKAYNYDPRMPDRLLWFRTILTGDIELDEKNSDLENYLNINIKRSVVQYPHHGAKGNFEKRCFFSESIIIIPTGIANSYDHPSASIFRKIRGKYILVNERTAFDYVIILDKD